MCERCKIFILRSNVLFNSSAPQWNDETWFVYNVSRYSELTVTLYDKTDVDDFIGQFIIRNLLSYDPHPAGNEIIGVTGQNSGSFHLSIQSMQTKQLPRYMFDSSCRYFCHNSSILG